MRTSPASKRTFDGSGIRGTTDATAAAAEPLTNGYAARARWGAHGGSARSAPGTAPHAVSFTLDPSNDTTINSA